MMVFGLVPKPPRGLVACFVLIAFSLLFLFVCGGRLPFGALDTGYSGFSFGGTLLRDVFLVKGGEVGKVGKVGKSSRGRSIIFRRDTELQLSEAVLTSSTTTLSSLEAQIQTSKVAPIFLASETADATSTARPTSSPSNSPSITSTPAASQSPDLTTLTPTETEAISSSPPAQRPSKVLTLGPGPLPTVAAEPQNPHIPKNGPHDPPGNSGKEDDSPGNPGKGHGDHPDRIAPAGVDTTAVGIATTTTTSAAAAVDTGTSSSIDSTLQTSTPSATFVSVSEPSTVSSIAGGNDSPPSSSTSHPTAAASPTEGAGLVAVATNNAGQPGNSVVAATSPPSTSTAAQSSQTSPPLTAPPSSDFIQSITTSLSYPTSCSESLSISNPSNSGAASASGQTPPANASVNSAIKNKHSNLAIALGVLFPILTLAGLVAAFIFLRRRISRANKARDIEEIKTNFSPPLVNPFEGQDIRGAAAPSNGFRDMYPTVRQSVYSPDHYESAVIIYPIEEESPRDLQSQDGDADSASEDGERQHDHRSSHYSNSDSSWIWYRPPMAI